MTPLRPRAAALALALLLLPVAACDAQRPAPAPRLREEAVTTAPVAEEPVTLRFHPAAYDGWLDAIPALVRVDQGLPAADGDIDRGHDAVVGSFCGRAAFPRQDVVDRRSASATGPEYADTRDLRIFTDDRAADSFQRHALRVVRSCAREDHGSTTWSHTVRPSRLGDGAFTVLRTYRTSGLQNAAADWWEVVRVGNSVLVAATGGEYVPGRDLDRAVLRHGRELAPVAAGLCVFTPDGCAVADPDIPAGFPLTAGFPDPDWAEGPGAGLAGPSRALPAPVWELCGSTLALPEVRDRMAAQWSNPEDWRSRQLVTFDDDEDARAFLDRLTAFYESCPRQGTGFGYTGFQHVELRAAGDESYALYRVQEYQGSPGFGVEITQVVRVGRAVLVDTVSNEGDARGVPTQLRRMTHASATIVARMCAWAEAGCA